MPNMAILMFDDTTLVSDDTILVPENTTLVPTIEKLVLILQFWCPTTQHFSAQLSKFLFESYKYAIYLMSDRATSEFNEATSEHDGATSEPNGATLLHDRATLDKNIGINIQHKSII
jgi:hypothetical protein